MSMIAIPISQDVSRLFREIEVDGARDPSDHITMFYLGDDVKLDTIVDIIPILYECSSEMSPFEATCSRITTFPKGNNGYPVIAEIKSDKLVDLRNKIKKMFDKNKIEYDDKFPDYKPHITLAYSKKKPKNIKIPSKFKWSINQMALYGGNEADSRIFVNFPFTFGVEKKAADMIEELSEMFVKITS